MQAVKEGDIYISPFSHKNVNPNSYNYRLGKGLKQCVYDGTNTSFVESEILSSGTELKANTLYLAHTEETIGSKKYMTSLIGRSSIGRLGLFIQITANVGHTGTQHKWTLELYPVRNIIVYPGIIIGQVSFWKNKGLIPQYSGYFGNFDEPTQPK